MSEAEFEALLKEKEKEGFAKFGWQCRVYESLKQAQEIHDANDKIVYVIKND